MPPAAHSPWLGVAGPCLLVLLVYVAAVGLRAGRQAENAVFVNPGAVGDWLSAAAIATVNPLTVTAVTLLAAWIVARREGPDAGLAVVVVVAGANVSTFLLSRGLAAVDPLGGEEHRVLGEGYLPSGHATAAASMACAVVAAVPAPRARFAALVAGCYVAIVGLGMVAPAKHHPSDVLAGFYVTAAWVGLMQAVRPRWPPWTRAWPGAGALALCGGLGAAGGVLTSVVSGVAPREHVELVLVSAIVIWSALLVIGASPAGAGLGGARRRTRSG